MEHTFEHSGITYTILCGKSAKSNNDLLDNASPDDVWFHVADAPSGHVFLVNPECNPVSKLPRQVITRCACICKATTKTSKKCRVIYAPRKNVAKTDVLGQVVPVGCKSVVV